MIQILKKLNTDAKKFAERRSRERATRETKQDGNIIQTSAAFASARLNDSLELKFCLSKVCFNSVFSSLNI